MIKYIAYCRKSTEDKHKQVLSITQQINESKELAEKEGFEIIEYLTESKTAKKPGREKFNKLINLIEKEKANGIIAWHPDRLARNTIDGGKLVYLLDTGKLQSLKFPTFWFENTPQGRFMLNMAFSQAKYYVDNLSENVKRGYREKLKRGILPNKAPTGYYNHPVKRNIQVNPKTALVIKKAFKLFSTGKYSNVSIQQFLFNHGLKGRSGKPLHLDAIKRILTNPFYYGLIKFAGETYQGSHTPLIKKSLFDQCQKIYSKNNQPKNKKKVNFAFLGLAKCVECGSAITAEKHLKYYKRTKRKVRYDYYRCGKNFGFCSQPYIPAKDFKKQIRKIVFNHSLHPQNANWMLNQLKKDELKEKQNIKTKTKQLKIKVKSIDLKLQRLLDTYLDQVIDQKDYQQTKERLIKLKLNLEEKINKVLNKGSAWIEPMNKFIKGLIYQQKIAKAKNTDHELSVMVKKLGSNFFLSNRLLNFSSNLPWIALVPSGIGTRAKLRTPELWQEQESNLYLTFFRRPPSPSWLSCPAIFLVYQILWIL